MYAIVAAWSSDRTQISFTGCNASDVFHRSHLEGDRGL